jgi:hypothetical protein
MKKRVVVIEKARALIPPLIEHIIAGVSGSGFDGSSMKPWRIRKIIEARDFFAGRPRLVQKQIYMSAQFSLYQSTRVATSVQLIFLADPRFLEFCKSCARHRHVGVP